MPVHDKLLVFSRSIWNLLGFSSRCFFTRTFQYMFRCYWNSPVHGTLVEFSRRTEIFQILLVNFQYPNTTERFHISMINCPCCVHGIPHAFLEIPRSTGIFQIRVMEFPMRFWKFSEVLEYSRYACDSTYP